MKINGLLTELRNIAQTDRKAADAKQSSGATRSGSDVVQISDRARTLKSQQEDAVAALKETPDIRQARVDQVKARVAQGYYDRPEVRQAVADSLLDSGAMKGAATEKRQANAAKSLSTVVDNFDLSRAPIPYGLSFTAYPQKTRIRRQSFFVPREFFSCNQN